jgi:hypothetical protein
MLCVISTKQLVSLPQSMLAWRAVFRPANIIRRSLQTPKRSICVSAPRAQYLQQTREPGVLAKIRFRADGKPRSRLVGVALGMLMATHVGWALD